MEFNLNDHKPIFIGKSDGTNHILREDGSYSSYRSLIRLADGNVEVTFVDGTTKTMSEAEAREATGWKGLLFTAEQKVAQARIEDRKPKMRWVDDEIETDFHPDLADYVAACAAGDVDAAAKALGAFYSVQGYTQYDEAFAADRFAERVIVRIVRPVVTKSGRVHVPGDRVLAARDNDRGWVAFSARSQSNIAVYAADFERV